MSSSNTHCDNIFQVLDTKLKEYQALYDHLDERSRSLASLPEAAPVPARLLMAKRLAIPAAIAAAISIAAISCYAIFRVNYCNAADLQQINYLVSLL